MVTSYKKITSHGSVSIPAVMRRELGLEPKDPVEVSVNGDGDIVLKQYAPRCMYCKGQEDVHKVMGRNVCTGCAGKLYGLIGELLGKGGKGNG